MNISYKKILNKSKLILSDFDTEDFLQNYLVKMLINNNIPGLLLTELNMVNSVPMLSYDITSRHSVISILENKKIDFSLFYSIMQELHKLCCTLDSFMLDSCYLLLSPEYIFLDSGMQHPYFCYCPICENNKTYSFTLQLKNLLEYAISKLNYDDKSCVAYVYSLHQKCIEDTLYIDDLLYYTDESASDITAESSVKEAENDYQDNTNTSPVNTFYTNDSFSSSSVSTSTDTIFINDSSLSYICNLPAGTFFVFLMLAILSVFTIMCGIYFYFIKEALSFLLSALICISGPVTLLLFIPSMLRKRVIKKDTPVISSSDFAPDNLISHNPANYIMPIGETVLINHGHEMAAPHLIYNGNDFSENISITEFPFTIGKLPDSVNHVIDNSLISRIHARFYLKEECYYIEDLNSSNGTYVNNIPISPHTMTEIHDGDYITLARLTYLFKLC